MTLSHKELEDVLSKSKKKPTVLQKKIRVGGAGGTSSNTKIKRDTDSGSFDDSIAGAGGAMTNKGNMVPVTNSNLFLDEPHDEEFEATSTGEYDVSSQSPVSPLRITRLLPALMNSDTTVNNKKTVMGSSLKLSRKDATDATVDAPSISQLLMSCLSSEDSAEKNNVMVHPPLSLSSLPSGAKKLIVGVRAPGSPLRRGRDMSTIKITSIDGLAGSSSTNPSHQTIMVPPDESISQQVDHPIDSVTGGDGTSTPEKRKQGRPQKYPSPEDGCNNSTISAKPMASATMTKLADEYLVPQCTMVANMEECSLDKNSIAQTNDTNIKDTAVTTKKTLKHCTIWTCDICRVATFDDYFDAEEHEKECAIANNLQEIPPPLPEEYERSRSPLSPLVEVDKLQSPPTPNNAGTMDLLSPTHFSPITLSSPKHEKNCGSGYQASHHLANKVLQRH